ncbi:hypothetical protein ES705_23174 [subsurface metagenome]
MRCPNCRIPIVKKKAGQFLCRRCGWFEKIGKEWQSRGELEPVSPVAPQSKGNHRQLRSPGTSSAAPQSRDIAGRYTKPSPEPKIRKILGGVVTITEIDK